MDNGRSVEHRHASRSDGTLMRPSFEVIEACRSCGSERLDEFLSLGDMPLADALVPPHRAGLAEARYPLTVAFCHDCTLVQILETVPAEVLYGDEYPYFSSYSDTLVEHARTNVQSIIQDRRLGVDDLAIEIASNDGYLLQWFQHSGMDVLGIDPAPGPAQAAIEKGIPTLIEFFGHDVAKRLQHEGREAAVVVANNVLAHVTDQNDFVQGIATLLRRDGTAVLEFPYIKDLIDSSAFDTIYHEHHCYFSVHAVKDLFERHGLSLTRVEHHSIHGGSLRCFFTVGEPAHPSVEAFLAHEQQSGLVGFSFYRSFAERVREVRTELRGLLSALKSNGARLACYGAAAKGATLLNYAGIGKDLLDYVVDRNVHKQGWLMPGVGLPIKDPSTLSVDNPDYVLVLAWTFLEEIIAQQAPYLARGGRFIVPVPNPRVVGQN